MAKAFASKNPVSQRMRSIRRVLWIVLMLNLAVAAAKYVYGVISGSASMQADGIHSVFDSAGNVVGLVGIALAVRPADEGHPYGHAKFETYASLAIGALLLLAAFEVGSSAIAKLVSGVFTVEVTPISFAVMIGTLAVNLGVTTYERRCAKRLKSEVLAADANHTLSDALVSVGVIVGLVAVSLGFPIARSYSWRCGHACHPRDRLRCLQACIRHAFRSCAHSRGRSSGDGHVDCGCAGRPPNPHARHGGRGVRRSACACGS